MISFLENAVLGEERMIREKVIEVLRKQEKEKKWGFDEMYESVEEVKGTVQSFWRFKDKTVQKIGNLIDQKKKLVHEKRKVLIDLWGKLEKAEEGLKELKVEKKWIEKQGEKVLGKLRRKFKGVEKMEMKLENEVKKMVKFEENRRNKREKEERKKRKMEEKERQEREKKRVKEEKERARKERERQKQEREREKQEREKLKKMQKEKARLEKEKLKEEREKARQEKERLRQEQKNKNKTKDLLVKKNSSMMDFFNQTKPNLKRVKNEESDQKSRWKSLGKKEGFGETCPIAMANLEKILARESFDFSKKDLISRFKSQKQKTCIKPKMEGRVVFNRFECYDGEHVQRQGLFRQKSQIVTGRKPLARDNAIIEYELDTEDELHAESCKSNNSEDEEEDDDFNEDDGGFIVSDVSCEKRENQNRREVKKQETKMTDLRRSKEKTLDSNGETQGGQFRFQGIRMQGSYQKINFGFLRREEIAKKKMEEEKERKRQEKIREKKLEAEMIKKRNEVNNEDKLKWIKRVYGKSSKKDLVEGGQQELSHLKINDLEAFQGNWKMTYYANLAKFIEFFGEDRGQQMYFDCLVNGKNAEIYESLKKKPKLKKKEVKSTPKMNLVTYFQTMEKSGNSQSTTPTKSTTKSKKKKEDPKKEARRAMKKDPANMRKLEEMILILGTGACKKNFDTNLLKKIKAQFEYFSDRKILMRVKELLRFGYLLSRDFLFSLLTSHPNKYLQTNTENTPPPNLLTVFREKTPGSQNTLASKQIVEDFFFGENLHLKLQNKFKVEQEQEPKA
jgi:hypothetical protein